MSNSKKRVLMQGNEACVNGALYAGMRFFAGYPITPSTEIAELSALLLPKVGGKFIQMEDEIAGMAAQVVIGMRKSNSTALVTDCMSAGSMPEGQYKLGEFDVTVKDGTARMEDGNLAGSILLLKDAIKNVVRWKLATPFEAVQMATITPAKSVGIDNVAGKIEVGRMADLVVLDDQLELQKVYLGGEEVC